MDAPEAIDVSAVLRTWRVDVANTTARKVAAALGVSPSAVANWESGLRTPGSEMLEAIDSHYRAGGAIVDLTRALGSPTALDPRSEWWHNYSHQGGPAWAWVRLDGSGVGRLEFRWGPLHMRLEREIDHRGVLVTVPASVANPPVQAAVHPAGWVDFGRGRLPSQLGIPRVNAVSHVQLVDPADHTLWIIISRLRPALDRDGGWAEKLRGLLAPRGDLVPDEVTRGPAPIEATDLTGAARVSAGIGNWSGTRYRVLREARCLSQADAARRVSRLAPASPVTDDQIALFESGGHPRVADLAARLDVVYGADGQSLRWEVPVSPGPDGSAVVYPPPWWAGPVWLTPGAGPGADAGPGEVVLRWAPWERRLRLQPGTTVTTRKGAGQDQPLIVELPPGWTLTAGVGAEPGAVDVNHGWHAMDRASADRIFNFYHRVYLELFGRTQGDLLRLLRSEVRERIESERRRRRS